MNIYNTFYEFNSLPFEQKLIALERHGTYLDVIRTTPPFEVRLYSLSNYYVEEYYYQGEDIAVNINAFTSFKRLDRYLFSIDISGALSALK
jgi:hypothetical protein